SWGRQPESRFHLESSSAAIIHSGFGSQPLWGFHSGFLYPAAEQFMPFPSSKTSWLSRFAWLTAAATLALICLGGLVTSHEAGLAVPDWPNSFGYNMFLFPIPHWVGGVLFEHTHRLIASSVGLLTVVLCVALFIIEKRRWVKTLGLIAVAAVIVQGILGGLRVT